MQKRGPDSVIIDKFLIQGTYNLQTCPRERAKRSLKNTFHEEGYSMTFRSSEGGSVGVIFAIALVPTTLAVGVGVDYSRANAARTSLQVALDAAVLAAANASVSSAERVDVGKRHFASTVGLSGSPTPQFTVSADTVSGEVTYKVSSTFMAIVGTSEILVGATAAARITKTPPCILLLEPTKTALTINSDSHLNAINCAVHINSSSSNAIYVNSNSKISANSVCVKGGYVLNGGSTSAPPPTKNCPPEPDPLASIAEPAFGSCTKTDLVVQGSTTVILSPGVYCKKLEIQNGATAKLQPGSYFFPDAEFIINAGGNVVGDGVTLFFNGEHGFLNANSGSSIKLKAPTSGVYAGIVLFQSRAASSWTAPPHIVNSDSYSYLEGTVYAPNGKVMLNSKSTVNQTAATASVIARTMELNSYGTYVARSSGAGGSKRMPILIK